MVFPRQFSRQARATFCLVAPCAFIASCAKPGRKLRQAGVEAILQVFEGQSHAQFLFDYTAPETKEAFEEVAQFFDRHLDK